jgi:hypothetical protein
MEEPKIMHKEAAERLGLVFMNPPHEGRVAAMRGHLQKLPNFEDFAKGGDMETAVDLLVHALDTTVCHALDSILRLDSVVHSRSVTLLAAMELFHHLGGQFMVLRDQITVNASAAMAAEVMAMPEDERAAYMEAAQKSALANIAKLLGISEEDLER